MRQLKIALLIFLPIFSLCFCSFWYYYSFVDQPTLALTTPTPTIPTAGTVSDDPFQQSRFLPVDPPIRLELNNQLAFTVTSQYETGTSNSGANQTAIWYPNQKIAYVFSMPSTPTNDQEIEFLLRTGRVTILTQNGRIQEYINFKVVDFATDIFESSEVNTLLNSPTIYLRFFDNINDGRPTQTLVGNIVRDSDTQTIGQGRRLDYEEIDIQLLSAGYLSRDTLTQLNVTLPNDILPYFVNFRINNKTSSPIPAGRFSTFLTDAQNVQFPSQPGIPTQYPVLSDTLGVGATDLSAVYFVPLNVPLGYLQWGIVYNGQPQQLSLQTGRGPVLQVDDLNGSFTPNGFVLTGIITTTFQEVEEYQVVAVQQTDFRLYAPYSDPTGQYVLVATEPTFWWEVRPDNSFPFTLTYQTIPAQEYIVFEFFSQPFLICVNNICPQPPTPTPDPSIPTATPLPIPTATPVIIPPTSTPLPQP